MTLFGRMMLALGMCSLVFTTAIGDKEKDTKPGNKWSSILGDTKSQLIDKGIEIAGKVIDKQIENLLNQTEKASQFLNKKIKLNIFPSKAFLNDDMFAPPGYNMEIDAEAGSAKAEGTTEPQPTSYPSNFIGTAILNGCWGRNYSKTDPCYNPLEKTKQCRNMLDGAAFIGVGFDGREEYSPESRRMSIIQRNCAAKGSYGEFQVPDTMNVHGIYDTIATMSTFSSRSEYQSYLQKEAGVSGSFFGFYGGVKKAWGGSKTSNQQKFLSVFDINIDRYEIFKDEVKPQDLSASFLKEFVSLPLNYFMPKAPIAYQDFIQRWGTHYIKSAKFGGQLEFRKTLLGTSTTTKEEVSTQMESEYNMLFFSVGSSNTQKSGSQSSKESKVSSSSLVAQGGDQEIAAILSDMYSPSFKNELKAWLKSIPEYPKAYQFTMGSITDLVDFRLDDLFPDKKLTPIIKGGCEDKEAVKFDPKKSKWYYTRYNEACQRSEKVYCDFSSRDQVVKHMRNRRASLMRAIEIYMDEGPMSITDITLQAGGTGCDVPKPEVPKTYEDLRNGESYKITFQMKNNLKGKNVMIDKDMSRYIKYNSKLKRWLTCQMMGACHLYDAFGNADGISKAFSVYGLVLNYTSDGSVAAVETDKSKTFFQDADRLAGQIVANVTKLRDAAQIKTEIKSGISKNSFIPCNVKWSNAMRLDPSNRGGRCVLFTAASAGSVFVIFSAIPSNQDTWYYFEIAPFGAAIYKGKTRRAFTGKSDAAGLGNAALYQSYMVCIKQTNESVVLEYGKTDAVSNHGTVYLTWIDRDDIIHSRFYAFGNADKETQIADAHIVPRSEFNFRCDPSTTQLDKQINICALKCPSSCDPLLGCKFESDNKKTCYACRYAKDASAADKTLKCLDKCPKDNQTPDKDKICKETKELRLFSDQNKKAVKLNDIDLLSDFTFCISLKIIKGGEGATYEIFKYVQNISPTESETTVKTVYKLAVELTGSSKQQIRFSIENSDYEFPADSDHDWHRFCLTRDAPSGRTATYKDDKLIYTQQESELSNEAKERGVGTIELGMSANMDVVVSDMGFWDIVLSKEDLKATSQTCGAAAGKLIDWFDIMNAIKMGDSIPDCKVTAKTKTKPRIVARRAVNEMPFATASDSGEGEGDDNEDEMEELQTYGHEAKYRKDVAMVPLSQQSSSGVSPVNPTSKATTGTTSPQTEEGSTSSPEEGSTSRTEKSRNERKICFAPNTCIPSYSHSDEAIV